MNKDARILLGHGSGGRLMHDLIRSRFGPRFGIESVSDSALLDIPRGSRLAFTTDSYVVSPLFFPGGSIGDLAVNGTVNDLAVSGATPLYLAAGFVIEEGLMLSDLDRIIEDMARAAGEAGVRIVAGDTKVVERGKADGLFITTSGVGVVPNGVELAVDKIAPGDAVLVSGPIGSHGIAVMAKRSGLTFEPPLASDTASLGRLTEAMLGGDAQSVRVMRDPTRGGLATTLKEFAEAAGCAIELWEGNVPVLPQVGGACELLGLDPLYVANEGILIAVVRADMAEYHIARMRETRQGRGATQIGVVKAAPSGAVTLRTILGGSRLLDMLQGEQLPRIC